VAVVQECRKQSAGRKAEKCGGAAPSEADERPTNNLTKEAGYATDRLPAIIKEKATAAAA
jgi:hypothetical protein